MPDDPLDHLCRALLDALEEREHRLLAWGAVDTGFSMLELCTYANEVLDVGGECFSAEDVIEVLLDRRWLFEIPYSDGLYRTRFAEGVRLFAELKQTFGNQDWRDGLDLIADFQVMLEKRPIADRSRSPGDLIAALKASRRGLEASEERVLNALLGQLHGLGKFQIDSTAEIRENLHQRASRGVIVCTGTGTGKSLAFYLPCLTEIAGRIEAGKHWAQCLAIYPRSVLLADQFASAYENARRLDGVLSKKRKLRIGAFYGSTPSSRDKVAGLWKGNGRGYLFPTMRCPDCESDLVWLQADLAEGVERLHCTACRRRIGPDEIVLTRERMRREPPDILFTTTEMLHKEMCSGVNRRIFGLGRERSEQPYLMLLDEAHTYSGTSGALAALAIRRWRRLVGAPVQFVGLSATLADAEGFFAQLVGLSLHAVKRVGVEASELKSSGREYRLVLRSNPVTGAGLLSTSIQSVMLMARLLEPISQDLPKATAYPSKLFVFTDDLDVVNRMYDNLLDAEGYVRRRPVGWKDPLACLRRSNAPDERARFDAGQCWKLSEEIGYTLATERQLPASQRRNQLRIGRTSSQDPDVDAANQVVVATAALEVGYDDAMVGAVLQHKTPQSGAAFLQRKGRAGRNYGARPWTIVVLSDFGRDRFTYQLWDQLFEPELKRPMLPISNRYVLKMQAVAATLDWIYLQLGEAAANVWMALCKKPEDGEYKDWNDKVQERIRSLIEGVLTQPTERAKLRDHLKQSLDITTDEALALMWQSPRALMTAVLPTAYRRLASGWSVYGKQGSNQDYHLPYHPLPEFMATNLFSDLNTPEVAIRVDQADPEFINIALAMKETCPGRVTRRFAYRDAEAAHWVPPPTLEAGAFDFPIEELYDGPVEEIGTIQVAEVDGVVPVRLVRLREVAMSRTPASGWKVLPATNAFPVWRSRLTPLADGMAADIPTTGIFARHLESATVFTHNGGAPISVQRFSIGSSVDLVLKDSATNTKVERHQELRFVDRTGAAAGVGFDQEVDGIRFRVAIGEESIRNVLSGSCLRSLRNLYFKHRLSQDDRLTDRVNSFALGSLAEVFTAMVLARAMRGECSVAEAIDWLSTKTDQWGRLAEEVLFPLFGMQGSLPAATDEDEDEFEPTLDGPRLYRSLRPLFEQPEVSDALLENAAVLFQAPDASWHDWTRRQIKAAFGGALLQACIRSVPDVTVEDLIVDLDNVDRLGHPGDIWITEPILGGGGVIEQVVAAYARDPRRFFLVAEMSAGLTDLETADASLGRVLELTANENHPVTAVIGIIRESRSHERSVTYQAELRKELGRCGLQENHPFMVALNARVLRAGSSREWDEILRMVLQDWARQEERLDIEIDLRTLSYIEAVGAESGQPIRAYLDAMGVPGEIRDAYRVLSTSLWPRGYTIRRGALEFYNRFSASTAPDPIVLRALGETGDVVDVSDPNWRAAAEAHLRRTGIVQLFGPSLLLQQAVLELSCTPLDDGARHLYPYVNQARAGRDGFTVTMHIREARQ